MAAEPLEPRTLLAVTATLTGGDLLITYNDPGDLLADITSDGTNYTVTGTGLASTTFTIAGVTGVISVADNAAQGGQQFKVLAGTALANPLQVNTNVEATTLTGGITATKAGDVLIGSSAITLADDISTATTNANITFTGAVTLGANTTLNAGTGAITFASTLNGAFTVAANSTGTTTFGGVVGGTAALVSLTTNAGGTASLKSVTTTGAQTYNDDTVTLNGTYSTTNSSFTVDKVTTLAGNTVVSTGTGAGNITFSGTLNGTSAGAQTLALTAGNVTFTGAVGGGTRLGAVSIASATSVTANAITAASLSQAAGSGTTTLNGAVNTNAAAGVSLTGRNLAVNAGITTTNSGTVTFSQSGTITIAAAGDITADGAVSMTATGGITTAGDVTTTADSVTFVTKTTLSGPVAISTGAGAGTIQFSGTLDGAQTLALTAGTGAIAFKGAVGGVTPLAGVSLLSASAVTADSSLRLDGAPNLAANGITVAANVNNVSFANGGSDIRRFTGSGIVFQGPSTNSRLSGFTVAQNGIDGVRFASGNYTGTVLSGNVVRDNGNTTTRVGNGITVEGSNLMIGWDADPADNVAQNSITNNALNGIEIRGVAAQNNTILANSIYLNGAGFTQIGAGGTVLVGKGIALTEQGNGSQVAPIIHDVVWDKRNDVVRLQVEVRAAGSYFVQVFSNTAADEQNIFPVDAHGFQGRTFVGPARSGSTPVAGSKPTIAGAGVVTGNTLTTLEIPASQLAAGNWLTATATALSGTTPTNTSEFSAGAQLLAAPALAVGGDGPSSPWITEYRYAAASPASKSIQLTTTGTGQALTRGQLQALARLGSGTRIVVTPTGGGANVVRTVASASLRRSVLTITLTESIGATAGTFVFGGTSLPAALLLNTSLVGAAAQATPLLDIGDAEIRAALVGAGVSQLPADAFVTRFQGGLRGASGDFNGDGHTDLVTVAGGLPAAMASTFGTAPLVLSIHNANPDTRGIWTDASVNLANVAGFVSAGYTGGFLVTVGNVWEETSGSGSVVHEVIVAAGTKIAVLEVTATRGGRPVIDTSTARVVDLSAVAPGARTTGLAVGNFRPLADNTTLDDILVATTTAGVQTSPTAADTSRVHLLRTAAASKNISVQGGFFVNSTIQTGPRGPAANAFLNGASLAVGDIDNAPDQRPELLLAAGAGGLGNFRVLSNAVVGGLNQATIDTQLGPGGRFAVPPRSTTPKWQPTGGPDFFVGGSPPAPFAAGANSGISIAVVENSGRASGSGGSGFRAEVFAALAATNSTQSSIRQFWFDEVQQPANRWRSAHGSGNWLDVTPSAYAGTSVTKKFGVGRGLRLG